MKESQPKKPAAWLALVIIVGALAFGAKSFVTNLTPYVTFGAARSATSQVQVMGSLDKTSIKADRRQLSFTILSPEGDRLPVRFVAASPANFAMATQVTAIGKFDGQTFQADNLLVKCPTKYQGTDAQPRAYAAKGGA
jgi:cytochrome c-type biogenesis protein CcmE